MLLTKYTIFCLLLSLGSALDMQPQNPILKTGAPQLKNFTIDLDKAPIERFAEPSRAMADTIVEIMAAYLQMIPAPVVSLYESKLVKLFWYFNNNEKYNEILGIVQGVNRPSVTLGKALLINSLYELESWCTSVIVRMNNGTIIHSRNLDFDLAKQMQKVTYNARFVHGDKHSFDATMFGGVVGTYTGMKPGAFSVSENQREFNKGEMGLVENLVMIFTGYNEISWEIRNVLDECDSWTCAHKRLSSDSINALGYIILAGIEKNEGVIISRNRFGAAHQDFLNDTRWYLVQTNSDHWKLGHPCNTSRCGAARKHIE